MEAGSKKGLHGGDVSVHLGSVQATVLDLLSQQADNRYERFASIRKLNDFVLTFLALHAERHGIHDREVLVELVDAHSASSKS